MTELEKMMSGQVFNGTDEEIEAIRTHATHALKAFNNNTDESQRDALQKDLFGKVLASEAPSNPTISTPLYTDLILLYLRTLAALGCNASLCFILLPGFLLQCGGFVMVSWWCWVLTRTYMYVSELWKKK